MPTRKGPAKKGRVHKGSSAAASKAAIAMHRKHPKGHLTPAMLAADRSNMAIARAAKAQNSTLSGSLIADEGRLSLRAGEKAARRVSTGADTRGKKHPLGTREPAIALGWSRTAINPFKNQTGANIFGIRKVTGVIRKVPTRISPSSFDSRTGWRKSRSHHLKLRLHARKPRIKRVKLWRSRNGALRPR